MPEAAAPAPAAPAAEGAAPAPTIDPSEAGRALAAQRGRSLKDSIAAQHAKLDAPEPKPDEAKEGDKEPTTAERLALLKHQRDQRDREKRNAAKAKELESREADPLTSKGREAAALADKGDLMAAIKLLAGEKNLFDGDKALFWELAAEAERIKAGTVAPDPIAEARRVAEEAVKKAREEDAQKAETERLAKLDAGDRAAADASKAIDDKVTSRMRERIAELPHVADNRGIPADWISNWEYVGKEHAEQLKSGLSDLRAGKETPAAGFITRYVNGFAQDFQRKEGRAPTNAQIDEHLARAQSAGYAEAFREQLGRWPSEDEVLDHFEAFFKKQLDDRVARLRPAAPAKGQPPPRVITREARQQVGSPVAEGKAKTYAEAVARSKAKLEGLG